MLSNSKLTPFQKQERKDMRAQLPAGSTLFAPVSLNTTFLAVPDGAITRIFSSVCSNDEKKFRRKVGEYHVMARYFNDASGGLILSGTWSAEGFSDMMEF